MVVARPIESAGLAVNALCARLYIRRNLMAKT
jgi:hypothetical protein